MIGVIADFTVDDSRRLSVRVAEFDLELIGYPDLARIRSVTPPSQGDNVPFLDVAIQFAEVFLATVGNDDLLEKRLQADLLRIDMASTSQQQTGDREICESVMQVFHRHTLRVLLEQCGPL